MSNVSLTKSTYKGRRSGRTRGSIWSSLSRVILTHAVRQILSHSPYDMTSAIYSIYYAQCVP